MNNRTIWFLFFYIILGIFVCYDIIYLTVIWTNSELLDLYNRGFTIGGEGKELFNYSSAFAVYGLPTLGSLFSCFGLVFGILSQSFILKRSTPKSKLIALSSSFIVLLIGFYFNFIGQLFYDEWNDTSVTIIEPGKPPVPAQNFYSNWMSLINIWIVFAIFFALSIFCMIVIVKLYYLNLQWLNYDRKENTESLELEITAPFPSNSEFDPNETQTITLTLDTDKISPWKNKNKKGKIKNKRIKKK